MGLFGESCPDCGKTLSKEVSSTWTEERETLFGYKTVKCKNITYYCKRCNYFREETEEA